MLRRRSGDQGDLWGYDGSNYSLWCTAAASEGKFACRTLPSVLHAASSNFSSAKELAKPATLRSAARKTRLQQCAALQDPSCKIRALTHVLLVAAGATALSLDRRVALRAAAVAVACPSRPAKAVLACVDGQGPWCGGLEPATNDRAQSAEAVKKAYEAELAKLVTKRRPPEPSDSQDQKK